MFSIGRERNQIIIVIGLLLLIVGVVAFALFYKPQNNSDLLGNIESNSVSTTEAVRPSLSIEIKNPNTITLKDKTILFLNGWNIVEGQIGEEPYGFKCSQNKNNCPIYKIIKDSAEFYFSTEEFNITFNGEEDIKYKTDLIFPTFDGEQSFVYYERATYIPISEKDNQYEFANQTIEIEGCITENVCLSTGVLPRDRGLNQDALTLFKELLISINEF